MDWLSLLGGLAGGLGQGLNQVNDLRQQNIQNQYRQREQDMMMQDRKRQAVMDAWNQIEGGQTIDPTAAPDFKSLNLPVVKGADGILMKPKTKQQQLVDLQIEDRQRELDEKADLQRRKDEFDALTPEQLKAMDPFDRELLASKAGYDKLETLTPEERIKFSEKIAVANASGAARIAAASIPRAVNPQTQALNQQKFVAGMRARAAQIARTGMGAYMPPDQVTALEEQIFQSLMQGQGQEQQVPQTPVAGNRKQFGKYTVEY
jgi:hypothetical protein